MALVGVDYRFIKVNHALCRMLGYTEEEIVGLTFVDITHPEDIEKDVRLAAKAFSGEIPSYTIEKRYIKKNKDIFWLSLTASVIRDESGKALYGLAMIRDISEQRRAESELMKFNEKLEMLVAERTENIREMDQEIRLLSDLLNRTSQPFGIGYPDGSFGLHNQAMRELIGYSKEEMRTVRWTDITPPEWLEHERKLLAELQGEDMPVRYEKEYIRKDGIHIPVELFVHRVNDESGNLKFYYAFVTDITLRTKTKKEMEKIKIELEKKSRKLEEANIALRVLLRKRDEEKAELEEQLLLNLKDLVHPCIEELKCSNLNETQKTNINILEANLKEIIFPFSRRLPLKQLEFTPKELQIVNLLRQGKTNKEIGKILHSSSRTIAFHRENIRRKFGLTNKKVNLKSYILATVK